jgi:ABC-2 type transport system ATP-binding protein
VISARALVKKFGGFRALDGLDLDMQAGEVHGFLGPNGRCFGPKPRQLP